LAAVGGGDSRGHGPAADIAIAGLVDEAEESGRSVNAPSRGRSAPWMMKEEELRSVHSAAAPPSRYVLAVASYDNAPPVLSGVTDPGIVVTGHPLTLSATATDRVSAATLHWDFGDGAGADGASVAHAYAAAEAEAAAKWRHLSRGRTAVKSLSLTGVKAGDTIKLSCSGGGARR
jgi:hypothetical protein